VAGTTIALHPGGSGSKTRTGLGFEVNDLDAALQRATEVGGRISSPPRERAQERIRVAELADTEGNLITVAELTTELARAARSTGARGPRQIEAGATTTPRGAMAQALATESLDPALGLGLPAGRPRGGCAGHCGDDRAGGLSLRDAVERCGGEVSDPEAARMRRLAQDTADAAGRDRYVGRSSDRPGRAGDAGSGRCKIHGGGAISKAVGSTAPGRITGSLVSTGFTAGSLWLRSGRSE
jgi:hypothetical protein